VLSIEGKAPEDNQARFIADELGLDYRLVRQSLHAE